MTATKLQSLFRVLGNNCFARYWLHYNYPAKPQKMGICALSDDFKGAEIPDLERDKEFTKEVLDSGLIIYVCDRHNEDGTPFVSNL